MHALLGGRAQFRLPHVRASDVWNVERIGAVAWAARAASLPLQQRARLPSGFASKGGGPGCRKAQQADLASALKLQLLKDVVDVVLDRSWLQPQFASDGLVGQAAGNQPGDLQ